MLKPVGLGSLRASLSSANSATSVVKFDSTCGFFVAPTRFWFEKCA